MSLFRQGPHSSPLLFRNPSVVSRVKFDDGKLPGPPYPQTPRPLGGEGSMKGDVKRKSFSADWSGEFSLASSPRC